MSRVVFGKSEAEIIRVLKTRLPGVAVAVKAPQTMPDKFVRPVAVGGSQRGLALSQRLVQLHFYAATESGAAQLAEDTLAALAAAGRDPAEKTIRSLSVTGEASVNPDPDLPRPRYSATIVMLLRGAAQ